MPRLPVPATIADAPADSQPQLEAVKQKVGAVPNLYRLTAQSPAALSGLLGFSSALGEGTLATALREQIALAVAEINGCDYCLAAHSFIGARVAKLDDAEIAAARAGTASDPRTAAALRFATAVVNSRGRVSDTDLQDVQAAGFSTSEVVEIVAHVALNTFTNYLNEVARTEVDFPAVRARSAA